MSLHNSSSELGGTSLTNATRGASISHRCALLSAESRAAQYKYLDIEGVAAHLHGMIDALQKSPKVTR